MRGAQGADLAAKMDSFDPDTGWTRLDEDGESETIVTEGS